MFGLPRIEILDISFINPYTDAEGVNEMAKYETTLRGDFHRFLAAVGEGILSGSASASYEDGSDIEAGDAKCAVRVYERYSFWGKNRVSLNITVLGHEDELFVSAITSGGSQAMFFKINTFGESNFLRKAIDVIEGYKQGARR